ncbi:MAG TPA: RNA polymerase sigma factor [Candidatus Krumholzibacteria bacterium]|nr:RNA polymerase sigma factor [Candidatus Krumholzibacteria bacterium]HRX52030.1 RNA polymerase sigma factor [Candidatus Krumholzibacteria bacterium]
MPQRTDDMLMTAYVQGDERALRVLVERWERPVFAFLVRMLGSHEEAQDICQDTFLKLVETAPRYRAEGKFRSWLFRIAGNGARNRLRRRKVLRWLTLDSGHAEHPHPAADALTDLARREDAARVRAALSRLPDRQRQALVLRLDHDLSYQEIADAMGASFSSVQMLLHRAVTALRRDVGAEGGTS